MKQTTKQHAEVKDKLITN